MKEYSYAVSLSDGSTLVHSAKGTTWTKKKHKYTEKKISLGKVNYVYKKGLDAYDDLVEDNEYIMDENSYDEKMAKVAESQEWKDIVKRKDPEYVRKNKDGTTSYLIDDFVAKKKHPVLDILDDALHGRELTVTNISKKSLAAAADDYVKRFGSYGLIAVTAMLTGSKARQGSYADDIDSAKTTAKNVQSTANYSYGTAISNYKKYMR